MNELLLSALGACAGALGKLAYDRRSGNTQLNGLHLRALERIADNSAALPDFIREARGFMSEGRVAMHSLSELRRDVDELKKEL